MEWQRAAPEHILLRRYAVRRGSGQGLAEYSGSLRRIERPRFVKPVLSSNSGVNAGRFDPGELYWRRLFMENRPIQPETSFIYKRRRSALTLWRRCVAVLPEVIEEAWRHGSLKYLIIGSGRVSTNERVGERAGGWSWDAIGLLQAVPKFRKRVFESLTPLSGSAIAHPTTAHSGAIHERKLTAKSLSHN